MILGRIDNTLYISAARDCILGRNIPRRQKRISMRMKTVKKGQLDL